MNTINGASSPQERWKPSVHRFRQVLGWRTIVPIAGIAVAGAAFWEWIEVLRSIPPAHRPDYRHFLLFAFGSAAVMGISRIVIRDAANQSPWSGAIVGSICGFGIVGWGAAVMLGTLHRAWFLEMVLFAGCWTVLGVFCIVLARLVFLVLGASGHRHFGIGGDVAIGFFSALALLVARAVYESGLTDISSGWDALSLIQLAAGAYFGGRGGVMQRRYRTIPGSAQARCLPLRKQTIVVPQEMQAAAESFGTNLPNGVTQEVGPP